MVVLPVDIPTLSTQDKRVPAKFMLACTKCCGVTCDGLGVRGVAISLPLHATEIGVKRRPVESLLYALKRQMIY